MRVISGEYRGRRLKALEGNNTRPTTDKVKESIYNMIGPYFDGGRVLDLFAGSGALGIEALSRGMNQAVFVDRHFGAIKIIKQNIALIRAENKSHVLKMDANQAIDYLKNDQAFDLILLDPPYATQEIEEQLEHLYQAKLIAEGAIIVCETDASIHLKEQIASLVQTKRVVYGHTAVTIYRHEVYDA